MSAPSPTPPPTTGTLGAAGGATPWVVGGALVSGFGNYLFQVIATRVLGDEAFAPLGVLWTIWYLLLTIFLFSIEAWVTRLRATGGSFDGGGRLAVWIGAVGAVLGGGTWLVRDSLFAGLGSLAAVAALLVVSYGAFAVVRGELAGTGRFRPYAVVTGLESVAKVAVLAPVALLAPSTTALSWIMPLGPVVAIVWWALAHRRGPDRSARSAPAGAVVAPGRFILLMAVPSAAAQVLLAAGPLVLVVLGASATSVSVFFVTITAARVPIVLAFGGLLSRTLAPMSRLAKEGRTSALTRIAVLTTAGSLAVGLVGGAVGAAIGPAIVALLFGAAFTPPGWLAGLTAYGVLVASGGMVLNQVLVAEDREGQTMGPWLAGLAVAAAAVVLVGGDPAWRVAVAFVAGETVAVIALLAVVHLGRAEPRLD